MTRYLLRIEYDGTPFVGWQRQVGQPSVQEALETAASALNGTPVQVFGAGRTDAGVHATGQAAHIDVRESLPAGKIADAMNFHLRPEPIAVLSSVAVSDDTHARFSALARHYTYRIVNRRADLAIAANRAWRIPAPLDADAMHAAAQHLVGQHDFSTFRDAQCQANSPIRTLDEIAVTRTGDEVLVTCSALSFLHRQVRSIVGSLVEVGRAKQAPDWVADILAAKDRATCGPVAPAEGLYLTRVDYPDENVAKGADDDSA